MLCCSTESPAGYNIYFFILFIYFFFEKKKKRASMCWSHQPSKFLFCRKLGGNGTNQLYQRVCLLEFIRDSGLLLLFPSSCKSVLQFLFPAPSQTHKIKQIPTRSHCEMHSWLFYWIFSLHYFVWDPVWMSYNCPLKTLSLWSKCQLAIAHKEWNSKWASHSISCTYF